MIIKCVTCKARTSGGISPDGNSWPMCQRCVDAIVKERQDKRKVETSLGSADVPQGGRDEYCRGCILNIACNVVLKDGEVCGDRSSRKEWINLKLSKTESGRELLKAGE